MLHKYPITMIAVAASLLLAATTDAALPPPTAAQQQAAAAKKAKDDAQAAKDKASLAASMDAVAGRWRARAASQGWATHAPVAIAAAPSAVATSVTANAPAGQPDGKLTPAGAVSVGGAPIRSEKFGTAPPSTDVKQRQTQAQPKNAPPTVGKGTPEVRNR